MIIKPQNQASNQNAGLQQNNGMVPNNGLPNQQMSQQQMLLNHLSNNNRSNPSGINWQQTERAQYNDPAMDQIKQTGADDQTSAMVMIGRVSDPMVTFIGQINNRTGYFYDIFVKTLENFRLDPNNYTRCHVTNRFIDVLKRNLNQIPTIVNNSSVYFGKTLIGMIRERGGDVSSVTLTPNDYGVAAETGIRNILFLELVSWLTSTNEGRELIFNLPAGLSERIGRIEKIKEHAQQVFSYFNLESPYNGINYEIPSPQHQVTVDRYADTANVDMGWYELAQQHGQHHFDNRSVGEAQTRQRFPHLYNLIEQPTKTPSISKPKKSNDLQCASSDLFSWEPDYGMSDLNKLTKENLEKYNLYEFLHKIPGEDGYVVDPENWNIIKHKLFNDVVDMCFDNTVVIVECAIQNILSGYKERVIRLPEGLTVKEVLTDPRKILPNLVENEHGLVIVKVEEEEASKATIDDAPLLEGYDEKKLAVVNAKQIIEPKEPGDLIETAGHYHKATKGATVNGRSQAAMIRVKAHSPFYAESEREKLYLEENYPGLFYDYDCTVSWYSRVKQLSEVIYDNNLSNGLRNFIQVRLTNQINDLLVSKYGFTHNPKDRYFLKADNILEQFDTLAQLAKQRNFVLYQELFEEGNESELKASLALFHHSVVETNVLNSKALEVGYDFIYYRLTSNLTPISQAGTGKVKKVAYSYFPEIHLLANKLTNFNKQMLISFNDSPELWKLTKVAGSDDFVTLVLVDQETPFGIMRLDTV